jgi:sterol desaturase/sphingolipid hydroxylase (fatty acid hydroxylase superfamily)
MDFIHTLINIDPNIITLVLLVCFFSLEQLVASSKGFKARGKHLLNNLALQLMLVLLNLFFVVVVVNAIDWLNTHEVGLFYLLNLPPWLMIVLGVISYDFVTYWIHRASHKVPLLWRFHRVHHSDTQMDSSTTFRFHPLELILIYQTGNVLTAAIFGSNVTSLTLYYLVLTVFFFFEHSAFRYPKWLNRTLGWVFVMPDFHRVHHHRQQRYTDTNFADIFSIWDRLFGTFCYTPTTSVDYGLDEFEEPHQQTFLYLLKSPFIDLQKTKSPPAKREE